MRYKRKWHNLLFVPLPGVGRSVEHAALIPFIPVGLSALCPCCNFTNLTPTDLRATPHCTLRESRHRCTHTPLCSVSNPPFFFYPTFKRTNKHPHRKLQTEHSDLRETENHFGCFLTLGDRDCSTHPYTSMHTSSPIWLLKSLIEYSSPALVNVFMPRSPQYLHRIESHSDLSSTAVALPAARLPVVTTQAVRAGWRPRFQDWGAQSGGGGPFDLGLGSSFMTVLGCLSCLWSPVYFYRAVDLDIYVRMGSMSTEFKVLLFQQQGRL